MSQELAKTNDNGKLTAYKSFDEFVKHESNLPTPAGRNELIAADSRQFIYVQKVYGPKAIVGIISTALSKTCLYLNMEVREEMVIKAAEIIVEDYPDSKIADLKMFEGWVMRSPRKMFRLDTRELVLMYRDYYAWREEAFAEHRESRHKERKKELENGDIPTDEKMAEIYRNMKYQAKEKMAKEQRDQEIKFKTAEEICAIAGVSYEEVYELHKRQWHETWAKSGIRDEMSFEDFCLYRKTILDLNIKNGKAYR